MSKSAFCFFFGSIEETLSTFNPWRGRVAPEDAAGLFTLNQYR